MQSADNIILNSIVAFILKDLEKTAVFWNGLLDVVMERILLMLVPLDSFQRVVQ